MVKSTIDGDTYAVHHFGSGYRGKPEERIRVAGIDAPEAGEPNFEASRDSAASWLARGSFTVSYCVRDGFGRPFAWTNRGADSLHVFLISLGLGNR